MKPTKNHVFCIGCKHHKILFESQAKADNFIKFNSTEILGQTGKTPSRSYYCSFCCGWHVTSIEDPNKAAARDKQDAMMWELLNLTKSTKDIKKNRKFPKSEQGYKLRTIAQQVDKTITHVETALYTANIHELRIQLDTLLNLENMLRTQNSEYGIDVTSIDKRYKNISELKTLFCTVFDFFFDTENRQFYLSSLSEEDMTKPENIIIKNIEIINQIRTCFDQVSGLSYVTDQDKIKELRNNILTTLIPQLKGNVKSLKRDLTLKAENILSHRSLIDKNYKDLILIIIGYLEDAHKYYYTSDFESCEASLNKVEILLPDAHTEVEKMLSNQVAKLKDLLAQVYF